MLLVSFIYGGNPGGDHQGPDGSYHPYGLTLMLVVSPELAIYHKVEIAHHRTALMLSNTVPGKIVQATDERTAKKIEFRAV